MTTDAEWRQRRDQQRLVAPLKRQVGEVVGEVAEALAAAEVAQAELLRQKQRIDGLEELVANLRRRIEQFDSIIARLRRALEP